ncbi:MAG: hypothetical protein IPK07_26845 [Deltaproteobacteria bacterium]|nr:hypothetical protein [Deltaproteobacteria bacterium]
MGASVSREVVFSLLLGFSPPALAHEGHEHKVMGSVVAVDASHIEVKATDGSVRSIQLTSETTFKLGDAPATGADVRPSDRVVVKFAVEDGKAEAREILLAARPASGYRSDRRG